MVIVLEIPGLFLGPIYMMVRRDVDKVTPVAEIEFLIVALRGAAVQQRTAWGVTHGAGLCHQLEGRLELNLYL